MPGRGAPARSPLVRAMPPGATPDVAFANRRGVLSPQISSLGTMSARVAARVDSALRGRLPGTSAISRPAPGRPWLARG